jgi:hypothetical protein
MEPIFKPQVVPVDHYLPAREVLAEEQYHPSEHFHGTTKPYVRWWWLAGPFREKDIVYQLDWIKAKGFGGVELAWLWPSWLGAKACQLPRPNWLDSQWSYLVSFAKLWADKIGLGCDLTLGSCWPFGGSCVKPEDAAQTFFGPSGQTLEGSWEEGSGRELGIVNHLSRQALENYFAALLPAFQPALTGARSALFCDSLELDTQHWWSPELTEPFARKFGYRIELIAETLDQEPDVRYDYRKFLAQTMLREFFVAFTDLCHQAGATSRVQCHGSLTDLLSSYAAVDIPESESLLFHPTFSRIPASAGALSGKPVVSCETFTCIYGFPGPNQPEALRYGRKEQVADLKLLADALFAQGINQILWHGMPFNGPGGRHEFYASVHVGPDAAFAQHLSSFNAYLETVSALMQLGHPTSRLAVYLPNEDNLMLDRIPAQERTPGAVYRWEMRHVEVPAETWGYAPLWISAPFLERGSVEEGKLRVGNLDFSGLYVDVAWLDGDVLPPLLRLAQGGLPVILKRSPKQPGWARRRDYNALLLELQELPNVYPGLKEAGLRPVVDGDDLPPFWVRRTEQFCYFFFAHPAARGVRYPMRYGQSEECVPIQRGVTLEVGPTSTSLVLDFQAHQTLAVRVACSDGRAEFINIGYQPPPPFISP